VLSVSLPALKQTQTSTWTERLTRGTRIYFGTPRLRGLLVLNIATAFGGAMVFVNTVVLVQGQFGLTGQDTAIALAAFGFGSMLVALRLPQILEHFSERRVMLSGLVVLIVGQITGAMFAQGYYALLLIWLVMGAGYSLVQTPTSKILVRSATASERPALFAAHFSLSHAGWMLAYPVAGWLMTAMDAYSAFIVLAVVSTTGVILTSILWPASDEAPKSHRHDDLADDHEHLKHYGHGDQHSHPHVLDALHSKWPR